MKLYGKEFAMHSHVCFMFHYVVNVVKFNFVQDIVEDMELIQRTSDLKWINQFIRQYVMHNISITEKWLKY